MRRILTIFFCFLFAAFTTTTAHAVDSVEVETSELELPDWNVPGDGKTPTFMQYLDAQNVDVKASKHLVGSTPKGDSVFSHSFDLPPALLQPSLGISYSSDGGPSIEMPYGWSLDGIMEICRPLQRAYLGEDDVDGKYDAEWLIRGPGFSGTLVPSGEDDYRFFLRSSSPNYVSATYDEKNDYWHVYSDGVYWTLEPADNGSTTPDGTAWWRVTEMQTGDGDSNYVTYSYHKNGRIKSIAYGGNYGTNDEHLVQIDFEYAQNTAVRTNARAGFVTSYKTHITKITIGAYSGEADAEDSESFFSMSSLISEASSDSIASSIASSYWYAYDFVTEEKDSLDFLTDLEREGKSDADVETIASFEYNELDTSDKPTRSSTTMVPTSLGATKSSSDRSSKTTKMLVDFNRDGLPDVVDSSSASSTLQWEVENQSVDHDARSFSWGGPWAIINSDEVLSQIENDKGDKYNLAGVPVAHRSNTKIDFADMDGDGYPDRIESGDEDEWQIYYGNGNGFDHETENAPCDWSYSKESWALNADTTGAKDFGIDVEKALIDLNGDGWLDAYDPDERFVCYHKGERGEGWEEVQQLDTEFEAIRSVKYTLASETFEVDFSNYYENSCEDSCEEAVDDAITDCVNDCDSDDDICPDICEEGSAACTEVCGCVDDECTEEECADYCEDADQSEMLSRAEAEEECEKECVEEAENGAEDPERQNYVSATDETKAFYDLNSDGLPDFVDASALPWQVYLNNGHDFEEARDWEAPALYLRRVDEGRPDIKWESKEAETTKEEIGHDAEVHQTLLDVDSDGLLDLAMGKDLGSIWYKNTGSGFEEASRALPAWWPDSFMTSRTESEVDGDSGNSNATGVTKSMVMDLDHDGALDAVSTTAVKYGSFPRAYILTGVKNNQGGTSTLAYRSSATTSPSGDFSQTQYMPISKHLVDTITSKDWHTGQKAETSFEYENGYYEDGVFQGFKNRVIDESINGTATSKIAFVYELDRDLSPLVTTKKIFTDKNLGFAPSLKRGDATWSLRYQVENTYDDKGPYASQAFHLLSSRKTTEYGEFSDSKEMTQTYVWDDYGNMTSYKHDGGGNTDDMVVVSMGYVGNAPTVYRDTSGNYFETALDVAGFAAGVYSVSQWNGDTTTFNKALDVGGLIVDGAAIVLPVATLGGVGLWIKAARTANTVDNVSDASRATVEVVSATNKADTAADVAKIAIELNPDTIVKSADRLGKGGVVSEGARAISKKIGHAASGGYESAFKGIKATNEAASKLIRDIVSNPDRIIQGEKTTDIYNASGQGVRINTKTQEFVGLIEASKATR